jgi:hypothetical protein
MYAGEPDESAKRAWFEQAFLPLLEVAIIEAVSWESLLEKLALRAPETSPALNAFYQQCLRFNPIVA